MVAVAAAGGGTRPVSAVCLFTLAGALLASLPGDTITLSWTHSIEKTEWREVWRAEDGRLVPVEARIKGFGAGMEPPPEARLSDGWLVWRPVAPPSGWLDLAASSFTPDHTLCVSGHCRPLHGWAGGGEGEPVVIGACAP